MLHLHHLLEGLAEVNGVDDQREAHGEQQPANNQAGLAKGRPNPGRQGKSADQAEQGTELGDAARCVGCERSNGRKHGFLLGRGLRPSIPQGRSTGGRGVGNRGLGWDYFPANTKSAIFTAAFSCIAGMPCEQESSAIEMVAWVTVVAVALRAHSRSAHLCGEGGNRMASYGPTGVLGATEIGVVVVAWLCFALVFIVHARTLRGAVRLRERRSLLGLALQIGGYGIVRAGLRTRAAFLPLGAVVAVAAGLLAIALLAASVILAWEAVRALGKQWSLAAQLVEGHELVTDGVYGLVRHPIYTAMFGMLLGSALAVAPRWALLAGTLVFLLGTSIRVRVEERLLIGEFGDAYREYTGNVPALVPFWPRYAAVTARS